MPDVTINTRKLGGAHAGRTVIVAEPEVITRANGRKVISAMPTLVELSMRDATSAPAGTRTKCSLVAQLTDDDDPTPLPVAQATLLPIPVPAFTVEFRLEMN